MKAMRFALVGVFSAAVFSTVGLAQGFQFGESNPEDIFSGDNILARAAECSEAVEAAHTICLLQEKHPSCCEEKRHEAFLECMGAEGDFVLGSNDIAEECPEVNINGPDLLDPVQYEQDDCATIESVENVDCTITLPDGEEEECECTADVTCVNSALGEGCDCYVDAYTSIDCHSAP